MFGGSSSLCRQTLLCWQSTHEKHEPITNAVRARTAARRIGRRIQPCDSLDGRESRSHGGSGYSYALGHRGGTPLWALQTTYLPRPSPSAARARMD